MNKNLSITKGSPGNIIICNSAFRTNVKCFLHKVNVITGSERIGFILKAVSDTEATCLGQYVL